MKVEPSNYNYGGDVRRPEFGCTLPETGQPAPCSLAAHLMNYIGRVNQAFDPGYNQPARAGRSIPGFIRADNRRDDELQQIPGLRRVEQLPRGYEYYINVWVVDNSVAAQTQSDDKTKRLKFRNDASTRAQEIVIDNDRCAEFLSTLVDSVQPDYPAVNSIQSAVFNLDGSISKPDSSIYTTNALRSLTNFGYAEFE